MHRFGVSLASINAFITKICGHLSRLDNMALRNMRRNQATNAQRQRLFVMRVSSLFFRGLLSIYSGRNRAPDLAALCRTLSPGVAGNPFDMPVTETARFLFAMLGAFKDIISELCRNVSDQEGRRTSLLNYTDLVVILAARTVGYQSCPGGRAGLFNDVMRSTMSHKPEEADRLAYLADKLFIEVSIRLVHLC